MSRPFFGGQFFGGGFFAGVGEVSGGVSFRYFTPTPPPLKGKKKKEVDRLIEQEARLTIALRKYQVETGADVAVLDEIARKLKELQLQLLRIALESALVSDYIRWKRQQEDEDIVFIMSVLNE